MKRWSLLPRGGESGWTPYAWLIYLGPYVVLAWVQSESLLKGSFYAAGLLAFLGLYFRGYWVRGRSLLWVLAGIVALAVLYSPFNWGGGSFFIYAAGFLGHVAPPSFAFKLLAGILAVIGLETWLVGLSPNAWIPAVVFSMLIGAVNVHFGERERANARLKLAQEEIETLAAVAERERIARDLHDLLGHTLSLITLKAELAAKLAERDGSRAAAEMREVERISREALAEVRQAVRGYRSQGLRAELANARLALGAAGVELTVEGSPFDLPAAQESVLALALREAVTNVVRHAYAANCTVTLRQRPDHFRLEVVDDGRGGRRWEGSGAEGFGAEGAGLTGMRERVERLGGTLTRETEGGTRLIIVLPLAGREEAASREATAEPSAREERA